MGFKHILVIAVVALVAVAVAQRIQTVKDLVFTS